MSTKNGISCSLVSYCDQDCLKSDKNMIERSKVVAKEVLNSTSKPRYVQNYEKWTFESGDEELLDCCYTFSGDMIGIPTMAKEICNNRYIHPRPLNDEDVGTGALCAIGKSDQDGKWYGWSHKGIQGFEVGDSVLPGHDAFHPMKWGDYGVHMLIGFEQQFKDKYSNFQVHEITDGPVTLGILLTWNDENAETQGRFVGPPKHWGRGAWTAKTEEDAKEMAKDYARKVA